MRAPGEPELRFVGVLAARKVVDDLLIISRGLCIPVALVVVERDVIEQRTGARTFRRGAAQIGKRLQHWPFAAQHTLRFAEVIKRFSHIFWRARPDARERIYGLLIRLGLVITHAR